MHSNSYHIELKGGRKIFFRYWCVENPKLCVCIIHGLGDHSGRYQFLVDFLNSKQITVCAIDYSGHGLATGLRGHIPSFETVYNEIDVMIAEAGKHAINIPIVLYGHSMGGNILLNYYIARKPILKGLIVTSPWFKINLEPIKPLINFVRFLQILAPRFSFNSQIKSIDLSRDANVLMDLKNDPLVHQKISSRLFILAYNNGKRVSSQGYRMSVPLLLMHGSADQITSHKASVEFSRNTGHYTTFKSWTDAPHELHNDVIRNEVFEYISAWIDEKVLC